MPSVVVAGMFYADGDRVFWDAGTKHPIGLASARDSSMVPGRGELTAPVLNHAAELAKPAFVERQ